MTWVTITLESECNVLGVFLHHPGEVTPDPLAGVSHSVSRNLSPGPYAVAATGTGNPEGREVSVKVETSESEIVHTEAAGTDGSIIYWFPFLLEADGTLLGGDAA